MTVKKSRAVRKPRVKEQLVSTSDLDAGFLQRPGKLQGMHYLNHQSLDAKHGIVVDVAVEENTPPYCFCSTAALDYSTVTSA